VIRGVARVPGRAQVAYICIDAISRKTNGPAPGKFEGYRDAIGRIRIKTDREELGHRISHMQGHSLVLDLEHMIEM
jgi:hypothetical protein